MARLRSDQVKRIHKCSYSTWRWQETCFPRPNDLRGRLRQDARPELAKIYRVLPDRAWWPAVGAPLERGLRSHCAPQAAWSKNSTLTASYGNSTWPESVRLSTPAESRAVRSVCTALTSLPTRRAASRTVTGPAPHKALSSSQRLAVRTFHRSSGFAKEIRFAFDALPVFHAWEKSDIASAGERTSRVTVFTIDPFDVPLEGGKELVYAVKGVSGLLLSEVPIVTLARFVVIS